MYMVLNATIGDVTSVVTKGTTPTTLGRQFTSHGVGFVKAECITGDGALSKEKQTFIDEETDLLLKRSRLQEDDVLFSIAGVIGRTAFVKKDALPANTNQAIAILRPDPLRIAPRFLYYTVRSKGFHDHSLGHVVQTAQANVSLGVLRATPIWLPSLPIQQRIAHILSAYDDVIENNQRRIKILDSMAQVLYREWFVHYRYPGHENRARVASALSDIPRGWDVKPLGDVATITMGLSPKGNTYNELGNGIPLVNGPVEFGERYTEAVKWTTAPSKLCKEGDLVVCVRGSTTGKYVRSDGDYCLGRGVCSISGKYQSFIDQLFENELPRLLAQTGGSTFPSWTGPQLKYHPVLCPPDELLSLFDSLVKPIHRGVLIFSRRIENIRRTRDLLLPRLLSGQIKVKAA